MNIFVDPTIYFPLNCWLNLIYLANSSAKHHNNYPWHVHRSPLTRAKRFFVAWNSEKRKKPLVLKPSGLIRFKFISGIDAFDILTTTQSTFNMIALPIKINQLIPGHIRDDPLARTPFLALLLFWPKKKGSILLVCSEKIKRSRLVENNNSRESM
jgi:hypothetical protein